MKISSFVPASLLRLYRAYRQPLTQEGVCADLAYAKFKEVQELMTEAKLLNPKQIYNRRFFYPSHLEQKVQELLGYTKQTAEFKALPSHEQVKLESLGQLHGDGLVRAFREKRIQNQKISCLFERLIEPQGRSMIVALDRSHAFYSSDLVVFRDDYYGPLPDNGVYERSLKEVLQLYEKCSNGTFMEIEGNGLFKLRIKQALKKLLTRKMGRELIQRVAGQNWGQYLKESLSLKKHLITLEPSPLQSCASRRTAVKEFSSPFLSSLANFFFHFKATRFITDRLFRDLYHDVKIGERKISTRTLINDQDYSLRVPDVILLAHELLHVIHHRAENTWVVENKAELAGYTNAEEKVTITGELNGRIQDPISENTIRGAFGFFPRVFHEGSYS